MASALSGEKEYTSQKALAAAPRTDGSASAERSLTTLSTEKRQACERGEDQKAFSHSLLSSVNFPHPPLCSVLLSPSLLTIVLLFSQSSSHPHSRSSFLPPSP